MSEVTHRAGSLLSCSAGGGSTDPSIPNCPGQPVWRRIPHSQTDVVLELCWAAALHCCYIPFTFSFKPNLCDVKTPASCFRLSAALKLLVIAHETAPISPFFNFCCGSELVILQQSAAQSRHAFYVLTWNKSSSAGLKDDVTDGSFDKHFHCWTAFIHILSER